MAARLPDELAYHVAHHLFASEWSRPGEFCEHLNDFRTARLVSPMWKKAATKKYPQGVAKLAEAAATGVLELPARLKIVEAKDVFGEALSLTLSRTINKKLAEKSWIKAVHEIMDLCGAVTELYVDLESDAISLAALDLSRLSRLQYCEFSSLDCRQLAGLDFHGASALTALKIRREWLKSRSKLSSKRPWLVLPEGLTSLAITGINSDHADVGALGIGDLRSLEKLVLSENARFNAQAAERVDLRRCEQLREVDLSMCAISNDGLAALAKDGGLQQVQALNVCCNLITDVRPLDLSQHKRLQRLDLGYNDIPDVTALGLATSHTLVELCLSHCKIKTWSALGLGGNATLRVLDLTENPFTSFELGLDENRGLRRLCLSRIPCSPKMAGQLVKQLESNSTIEELCLDVCKIKDPIAELLDFSGNRSLRELDLSHNDFTDEGMRRLAERFRAHPTLEKLHLVGNRKITGQYRTELRMSSRPGKVIITY